MHGCIWTKGDCDHHSNYDGGGDDENYCDKKATSGQSGMSAGENLDQTDWKM